LFLALYYFSSNRIRFIFLKVFVILLVFSDLFMANYGINIPVSKEAMGHSSRNLKYLKKDQGTFRILPAQEIAGLSFLVGSYDDIVRNFKDVLVPNLSIDDGLSFFVGRESIEPLANFMVIREMGKHPPKDYLNLLSVSNVKYSLEYKDPKIPQFKLVSIDNSYEVKLLLYENLSCLPRSFEVQKYKVIKDRSRILKYLFTKNFDPKNEMILEEEPPKADRFYFVSDTYYPGWKAYVDGKETKIYRANYLFRAVPLTKGKHLVKFVYDPWTFKLGLIISTLAFGGIMVFVWKNKSA